MIIFLERLIFMVVIFLLATQIIVPLVFKLPLFFSFRRKTTLDEKIAEAKAQKIEAEKALELLAVENNVIELRSRAEKKTNICSGCGFKTMLRHGVCPECGEQWLKPILVTPAPPDIGHAPPAVRESDSHAAACDCQLCRIGL